MAVNIETKWTLETADGAVIYGVKNTAGPAQKAIYLVHGLTGHMYEYTQKSAADHFVALGYDLYRFNLYAGDKGARRLVDCTLDTHAADLNTVIEAFAPAYEKNFAVGHSYGGITVMIANSAKLTAASLWDPSYNLKGAGEDFAQYYKPMGDYVAIEWGVTTLISKAMHADKARWDGTACTQLAAECKHPVQVIFAGDGYYVKQGVSYHSAGHALNCSDVVAGTQHCFYEGQSCEALLQKTEHWFGRF